MPARKNREPTKHPFLPIPSPKSSNIWRVVAGCENETQNLRMYMSQIRRKLEPGDEQPQMIAIEPGVGYWFQRDEL
jgi:DNA-binding response OmpR family regulator